MLKIVIKTVAHSNQRYDTCGDWQWDQNGELLITVSDMGDYKKELLVALHEFIEVMLCKSRGISQELVDKFDMEYEANRSDWDDESEPGDDTNAPYKKEHFFATSLERLMAAELGVDWNEYEKTIMGLPEHSAYDFTVKQP